MSEPVDKPRRLEKSVEIGTLLAYYGGLLTEKQREALRLHYEEDYSLGEIAEALDVSRQNVYDSISRSEQKLRRYEETLGCAAHARETAKELREILTAMDEGDEDTARQRIRQLIHRQEGE